MRAACGPRGYVLATEQQYWETAHIGDSLTPRELAVLQQMALGRTDREISKDLSLGEYTIKDHVSNIIAKMRVRNRTHAVAMAIELKIVRLKSDE